MTVLVIILSVIFCLVALLLIFLVAVQDEKSSGLGGIFNSSSNSILGTNTGAFITKATTALAILFMVLSLVVALLNKESDAEILNRIAMQEAQAQQSENTTWFGQEGADEAAITVTE